MADGSSQFELDARILVTATEQGQTRQFPMGLMTVEGGTLVIGRSRSADLTLHDDYISNRHVQIVFRGGKHVMEELGSTHGTQLNGQPVKAAVELKTGDVVTLGKSRFEYRLTRRAMEEATSLVTPAAPAAMKAPAPKPQQKEGVTRATEEIAPAANAKASPTKPSAAAPAATSNAAAKPVTAGAAPGKPGAVKNQAGGGAGRMILAGLVIVGILTLLCYLAWQLFFAGGTGNP